MSKITDIISQFDRYGIKAERTDTGMSITAPPGTPPWLTEEIGSNIVGISFVLFPDLIKERIKEDKIILDGDVMLRQQEGIWADVEMLSNLVGHRVLFSVNGNRLVSYSGKKK